MGNLFRLQERLYNTPHLVTQESFDQVLNYLSARNSAEYAQPDLVL